MQRAGVRGGAPQEKEGWHGWDAYAPFYDWENAQTLGRRDVAFWQGLATRLGGPALELGCGTGRVSIPVARTGVPLVGVDRSADMLARAARRRRRASLAGGLSLIRGDIRHLPVRRGAFRLVMAPYGVLQSLVRERDLAETLEAVARVLQRGGVFGLDLVSDVPAWQEYTGRVPLRGTFRRGVKLTLIESVRQDRRRRLTRFDQDYIEHRGARRIHHRFSLTFRTLSIRQMTTRLERAGFRVEAVLGDYAGGPWHPEADAWLVLARRV
ncbi:MAG: class I SAM-dependent methyltransferase [Acidobacteriota bacterium]|nr:class I SAM-dependent methyltransferase [Acidobacteriota bacterium]